jgi:Fic family protein
MVTIHIIRQGKKQYFYIEHTIRENKEIKTKRQYLGNKLPSNIEELKEIFMNSLLEEIYSDTLNTIKNNFNKESIQYPASAKDQHIESFMIRFTYNTNRIEGSTLTLKETADLLEEQITPHNRPLKDVKEAEAQKKVFYEMLNHDKELTLQTVLDWHRKLFAESNTEIAGKIRKHPVAIARSKVELPLPLELETLLHEFFRWYRKNKDRLNPVILAAMVHLKFVTIHPFSDGNGRISRLMMNFVLKKHKYPMLNIEYINRAAYYNALERSQTTHKDNVFVNYLVKRYLKSYGKYAKK